MRLMLQAQHVQPAHQPGRPRRRLSQRLPAQERHQQRLLKHQKVLPLQSPQKRGSYQCQCRENVRNECGSVTKICSHFCIHRDHESVRSCHLSPGCGGLKRGSEIIRNERSLERQQRSFLGNGGRKFREGGKDVRDERRLLKRQRDRVPQLRQAQNSGCIICQCRVNKCRAGLSQCHRCRKVGRKCCIVCFNSHNEGWRSRCTGQRSSEVSFRSEDIRDERESVGNQRRILKNGCRIIRQFGGVIGIIGVCFKR